jgi:hypothetical protein
MNKLIYFIFSLIINDQDDLTLNLTVSSLFIYLFIFTVINAIL